MPPPPCSFGTITNTGAPTVTPVNTHDGGSVSTSNGSWSTCGDSITGYNYLWLRSGAVIPGATAPTYHVGLADVGSNLNSYVQACDNTECSGYVISSNACSVTNQTPLTPAEFFPFNNVAGTAPTLVADFTDPDPDQSGYVDFWVYRASDNSLVASGSGNWVLSGGYSTWTTPTLPANQEYYYVTEAVDASGASSTQSGQVKFYASVPTPGSPTSPPTQTLATTSPVLSASASEGDLGLSLNYQFEVATDSGFSNVAADSGWVTTTSTWAVPPGYLADGGTYYWRAIVEDPNHGVSDWSAVNSFIVRLPKLGARGYWPMWSHGPLAVNEANGNLVVSVPGPSYPTAAGSMGATLTYNSQSNAQGPLGTGWTLNVGDQGASPPTELIDHTASAASPQFAAVERVSADGSSDYYTQVGSSSPGTPTSYVSAAGDGSQLTKNADGSWSLLDTDGSIYTFGTADSSSGIAPLQSAEVVEGSKGKGALYYTSSTSHPSEIASIADGSAQNGDQGIRTLTFAWANASDTGSCSGAILCVTGPDNVTWKYIGDAQGRLVQVSDGARPVMQIAYGSNGLVSSVKNADDLDPGHASPGYNATHSLAVSYDTNTPHPRAVSVSDGPVMNQSPATSTWTFAYHPGSTSAGGGQYGGLIKGDSPVAYYPLDETSGANAADASGNGQTGSYGGGYTLGLPGASPTTNTAVSLDGNSGQVSVPDSPSLRLGGQGTIEFWVKLRSAADEQFLVGKADSAYALSYGMQVENDPGNPQPALALWVDSDGSWGPTSWAITPYNVSLNAWHYIVGEWDSSGLHVYVDGSLAASAAAATAIANTTSLRVGYCPGGWIGTSGIIDEVAIYGTALSTTQINAHYAKGQPVTHVSHYDYLARNDGPAAYYPLDETSGTTASDASGNGNNLTYSGSYTRGQPAAISGTSAGTSVALGANGQIAGSEPGVNTAPGGYTTVEFWLYWNGNQGEVPVGFDSGYGLFFNWGLFGFWTGTEGIYGATPPSANAWHHVVAEFYNGNPEDGSQLWIDGQRQTLVVDGTIGSNNASSTFGIGDLPNNPDWHMGGGQVDDVALYGYALPPAEIAAHYAEGTQSRTADGYTTLTTPRQQGQNCPAECVTTYYDNLGHPIETVDQLGRTTQDYYNNKNELLWSEDADRNPTDYLYGGPDGKPTGNSAVPDVLLQTVGPDPDGPGSAQRPVTSSRYDETKIGTAQAAGPSLTGLQASYYTNPDLIGRAQTTETDPNVDAIWSGVPPALSGQTLTSGFSVRWIGDLAVSTPGAYTLSTPATNGTRLTIDGIQAISNWTTNTSTSQPIVLSKGLHRLALEYFSNTSSGEVHLHWACSGCSPAITDQAIPTTSLLPGWLNQTSTVSPAGRLSFSHYPALPETEEPDYTLAQVGGSNLITSYTYDDYGRLTGKVMPNGNASASIGSTGDLSGAGDPTTSKYGTSQSYYAGGDTKAPPNAPNCSGSAVNQGQQLKSASPYGEATTTYVYNLSGNTIAKTNGAGTTCATYDNESRLTSSQAPGDALPTTYTYDPNGTQLTATGSAASYLGEYGHATSNTASLTKTITLTGAPGAGAAVFLRVANTTTAPSATAVTDSRGNTWTLLKQGTVGVPNSLYATLQNAAPLQAGDVVTITWSTNVTGFAGALDAFTGVTSLTPDQTATASSSTNTTARNTGTTATTTHASELQIAAWGINALETSFTPSSGASQLHTAYLTNSSQTTTEGEYKFVNATGAYNLNATGGVSGKYDGFIVTLPAVAPTTVTTYYDEQGRLVDTTDSNGAEAAYTYDADGNQATRIANKVALSQPRTCPSATDYCTTYNYDAADQLTSETDPASKTYSFYYDNRGNLRGTQYPTSNPTFSWIDTNPLGEISDQYNRHGTITAATSTPPSDSSPLADFTYTYDADGKRLSEVRKSGSTSQTTTYSYDNLGRLSQTLLPNGTCRNYLYDYDSNRTEIDESTTGCNGTFNQTAKYTYDPTTTLGVDELTKIVAGGITTNYAYTGDGQTASQGSTSYTWDGSSRIKTTTVGSNTISYAYDPTGALKTRISSSPSSTLNYLLGDLFESNASGTITTSYSDGPAGNLATYNGPPTSASTPSYLYYDDHGNLAAEANTSGTQTADHKYDPFGAPTDSLPANTTVHRFTGRWDKQYDTTSGLILMGARPYDPTTGRFLSNDPIPGGSLNNYDYAGQDPINNYDLAGTDMKEEDELGATGGIYPRPSPGDAAGSRAVDEIGTEFGQTRYWQVSRLGQQYLRDGARSLEKSIRSWEGRIAEHEEKIRLAHETGLVRPVQHWEAEIKNFRSLTVAARFVLKYGALW